MKFDLSTSNPLLLPHIIRLVIENVELVPDLLNCACVNSDWNGAALKKLYQGSLSDMQFRTPDITSINCLFVASRKRFVRNMSFVKHLLLTTDTPGHDVYVQPDMRLVCIERCRVLHHRKYAESLLGLQGTGLASLTIPFEIPGQDWSAISDLLLASSVEFLAIDAKYCDLFQSLPANKLSNIQALTIYRSTITPEVDDNSHEVGDICRLLYTCNPRFFYLEETCRLATWSTKEITWLIDCLQDEQNLEVLALEIPRKALEESDSLCGELAFWTDDLWPRLKALYLDFADQHWLKLIPGFEDLQIFQVHELVPTSDTSQRDVERAAIENILICENLRILDISFEEVDGVKALQHIAHGCPLLRKLEIWTDKPTKVKEKDAIFFDSVSALPNLEILTLNFLPRVSGARLLNLARHCPRLTVLDLGAARVRISLAQLREAAAFKHLEIMEFGQIWFMHPYLMLQHGRFQNTLTEWRRVFPKLRAVPCPNDGSHHDMNHDYMSDSEDTDDDYMCDSPGMDSDEENDILQSEAIRNAKRRRSLDEVSAGSTEDEMYYDPGPVRDDLGSIWFKSRAKLWRALGLTKSPLLGERIGHIWQSNAEIEIIGWPVLSEQRFRAPDKYSSTTKGLRWRDI